MNDGSWRRAATSPGATSCATSNTRTLGSAARVSTWATAELVVPRSMPIRYRAGTDPCTAVLLARHLARGDQLHEAVDEGARVVAGIAGQRRAVASLRMLLALALAQQCAVGLPGENVVVLEREVAHERRVAVLDHDACHVRLAHLARRRQRDRHNTEWLAHLRRDVRIVGDMGLS